MLHDLVFLRRLRVLGVVEGISTLLLFFVAMPLKYFADLPMAVTIVGSIHGFLFVLLVLALVWGVQRVPLPPRLAAMGAIGAIVPFGPFVVDHWLGKLAKSRANPAPAPGVPAS